MPDEGTPAERPQVKPFGSFLQESRRGVLHTELSEQFADLVAACRTHGKKGSLTLTITVAPNKDGETLMIGDDLKVKAPQGERPASVFWADEHGNVSTRNPRQPELPLRDASAPAAPAAPAEAATGTDG